MIKEIAVVTMSDKHKNEEGGYCVAGFDLTDQNKWIRLIGIHEHFRIIDTEAVYASGEMCKPLDVIRVEVRKMDAQLRQEAADNPALHPLETYEDNMFTIQPENYVVFGRFELLRRMDIKEMLDIAPLEQSDYIYKDTKKYLTIPEAIENNKSLIIAKVDNLELYPKKKYQNDDEYEAHYKAKFDYNGVHYEDLTVTDPDYEAELTGFDGLYFGETYLVISIGQEFMDKHYKIIARIFEVVYTIENNRLNMFHAYKDCSYLERYADQIKYALYDDLAENGMKQCKKCEDRLMRTN